MTTERRTAYNSTYKKLAVQWLNVALCFVSSFVVADSLVLRNCQLLVAAKRCAQLRTIPMINLFRRLFKRKKFDQDDKALVEGEFLWCIVGNIVGDHFYGEQKEIKSGTKHFRPGAKVYCIPEFGGMAHETIRVIGKPRGSRGMINVIIPTKRIKNFRLQKVYSDSLFEKISELTPYRVNNSYRLSKKELVDVLEIIKTYTEEV